MTDEERLQMITEQLIIVRDNLFRGMSKSMQKLQARSINEVLELPNFTESPQRTWVGLSLQEQAEIMASIPDIPFDGEWHALLFNVIEAKLKEKNT